MSFLEHVTVNHFICLNKHTNRVINESHPIYSQTPGNPLNRGSLAFWLKSPFSAFFSKVGQFLMGTFWATLSDLWGVYFDHFFIKCDFWVENGVFWKIFLKIRRFFALWTPKSGVFVKERSKNNVIFGFPANLPLKPHFRKEIRKIEIFEKSEKIGENPTFSKISINRK